MAMAFRLADWNSFPPGPSERWPRSLNPALGIVLGSASPRILPRGTDGQSFNPLSKPLWPARGR